jgi:Zn-dependent protease with chaperone function
MDFFEHQERARKRTKWLVCYFIAAVVIMIAVIYFALALVFSIQRGEPAFDGRGGLWNPWLLLGAGGGTLLVILIGSLIKISELSQGGSAVATMLGGRPLSLHPTDLDEKRLRNVVEEMALAAGVPVPEIYVLDQEEGINAFAAGFSPSDAAVGVTRGSMKLLSRDELQGVIAHEFSHILNGDMRLNIRLIGLVHGILCLAIIGRILLRTAGRSSGRSSGNKRGGNPLPFIGLVLLVVGMVGVFFGRLIKSAVSRQREFLADAAAVQFTRHPPGLAGALKKIGGLMQGSRLQAANAEEASHLFFGNGLKESWFNWMSTHPPLTQRIRLLEPGFDGNFPVVTPVADIAAPAASPQDPASSPEATQPAAFAGAVIPPRRFAPPPPAVGREVWPSVEQIDFAVDLVASLPEAITAATREPFAASALVYGLLLSPDAAVRETQLRRLEAVVSPAILRELNRLWPHLESLEARHKLPLVELALPALRGLSPGQFEMFTQDVQALIAQDAQVDLFEFALQKMLLRHLAPHFGPPPKLIVSYYALRPLLAECSTLLSTLARCGQPDEAAAVTAFAAGAARLGTTGPALRFLPEEECGLGPVDAALTRLAELSMAMKKKLLLACAHTVAHDGVVQVAEAELIRAIADALGCSIPPPTAAVPLRD